MTNQQDPKSKEIDSLIKETIAVQLGVDAEDVSVDDSFSDDLHMGPTELSELIEGLGKKGIDATRIDLSDVVTVSELIELLD
jgi:acyl carrier protein